MAETIRNGKWLWYDMRADLERAGAESVTVDPLSVEPNFSAGSYKGNPWTLSWLKDALSMLSFPEYDEDGRRLTDAFAKVFESQPFCRYRSLQSGLATVEWDKYNPEGRYTALEKDSTVKELVGL